MSFFAFNCDAQQNQASYIGSIVAVSNRKVTINVPGRLLDRILVGNLVAVPLMGQDRWIIGIIDRVNTHLQGEGNNTAGITLVGTVSTSDHNRTFFTRALSRLPRAKIPVFGLSGADLSKFMELLVRTGKTDEALLLGHYTLDLSAAAYLDGDKFFQRHAALLGSTGSGKSWAVTTIIEQAAKLPSANLIVFDLHGEYSSLSYARKLRIPGPDDLNNPQPNMLFLPYWLMTAEEFSAALVDPREATAHDQTLVLHREIENAKGTFLKQQGYDNLTELFTVDSPIPFSLDNLVRRLDELNTKVYQEYRGSKQGEYFGMFSRLLVRLQTKRNDKRYGFLFNLPDFYYDYEAFAALAQQLLDFTNSAARVRIIDFSEVPVEIMPIMLGIVARLVYYLQFWMSSKTRHPVALICDEAHRYLPRECNSPNEERTLANFQKIAKEGRKYGVSLVVVSQRPAELDTTVLSQCNNVLALRLTNTNDQAVVCKLVPDDLMSILDTLPVLETGEVLALGDAVLLPSRITIQPPHEKPVSATVDFWSEWKREGQVPDWHLAADSMRYQRRSGNNGAPALTPSRAKPEEVASFLKFRDAK